MINIITMAYDIGKYDIDDIYGIYNLFYNSLSFYNNKFTLICYTNLDKDRLYRDNVVLIYNEEFNFERFYPNEWNNISFNRLHLASMHLSDRAIWLDLDTIICRDLLYMNKFNNFIVRYNLDIPNKLTFNGINIHGENYFLGHLWKVDKNLLEKLYNIAKQFKELPPYDIQDYITLLYYEDISIANVLNDLTPYIVNWEWSYGHPYPDIISDKILFKGNHFVSKEDKIFAVLTFTFPSLIENLKIKWETIEDKKSRDFLLYLSNQKS